MDGKDLTSYLSHVSCNKHLKLIANLSLGHLFQAASQGLLDHLHNMVPVDFLVSQGIQRLMVTGSVPTKNSTVCQRLEELYGRKLEVILSNRLKC